MSFNKKNNFSSVILIIIAAIWLLVVSFLAGIITFLLTTDVSAAETLTVTWGYSAEDQAKIDGFRVYTEDNEQQGTDIAPNKRSLEVTVSGEKCVQLYCTAFKGTTESKISRIANWCPPLSELQLPGNFIISGKVHIEESQ